MRIFFNSKSLSLRFLSLSTSLSSVAYLVVSARLKEQQQQNPATSMSVGLISSFFSRDFLGRRNDEFLDEGGRGDIRIAIWGRLVRE